MLKNYIHVDKRRQLLAESLWKLAASATAALCKYLMSSKVYTSSNWGGGPLHGSDVKSRPCKFFGELVI
jgi:hypothetical protein